MSELEAIEVTPRDGKERFRVGDTSLNFALIDFWRWASSDLVSNATRGVLAEYLVSQALGLASKGVRDEWAAYDLTARDGTRIEVKSSGYIQSWRQKKLSAISFLVPKTRALDPKTNQYSDEVRRQANVYVFALLAHTHQPTIEPMDLSQWEFFVLPTSALDARTRSQHSITLPSLRKLAGEPTSFDRLRDAVESIALKERRLSNNGLQQTGPGSAAANLTVRRSGKAEEEVMSAVEYYSTNGPGAGTEDFGRWYSEHPDGFYLNVRGQKAILHKVGCHHLGAPQEWRADDGDVTANPKVCSRSQQELETWAELNGKKSSPCADCI